jgi:hypothetical protein
MSSIPVPDVALEFHRGGTPEHRPGSSAAPANELVLRNMAFEVDDPQAAVDRAATDGYRLVGGIGKYEDLTGLDRSGPLVR